MSPFIVTTKRPMSPASGLKLDAYLGVVSRRAVATLDEARTLCHGHVRAAVTNRDVRGRMMAAVDWIDEPGASVGPLPDGTVIEVEPSQWYELASRNVLARTPYLNGDYLWPEEEILAAYNAKQAT